MTFRRVVHNGTIENFLKDWRDDITVELYHFNNLLWRMPLRDAIRGRGAKTIKDFIVEYYPDKKLCTITHYTK